LPGISSTCAVSTNPEAVMINLKLLALLSCAVMVAACNTMEGLGKDISKVGDKIEKKAEEKKSY